MTSGRGTKGSRSRSGGLRYSLREGGAVPLYRRLPKRGFNNKLFTRRFEVVNISELELFDDGAEVGVEQLLRAGLILGGEAKVKILGDGELTKKLQVIAHKFSKSAEEKIVGCGGTVTVMRPKSEKYIRRKKA
jgi:large subunit ribosomal protein L15